MSIIPHESLQVGQIYKIDKSSIVPETTGSRGLAAIAADFKNNPQKVFIRIDSARPTDRYTMFSASVLDTSYNVVETRNFPPGISQFIPMSDLKYITEGKSNVQAVKDILAQRGVPESSDSGPLSTILGMAGIKAPPKQSGVGRKTRKSKKSHKKTQKRRARK